MPSFNRSSIESRAEFRVPEADWLAIPVGNKSLLEQALARRTRSGESQDAGGWRRTYTFAIVLGWSLICWIILFFAVLRA